MLLEHAHMLIVYTQFPSYKICWQDERGLYTKEF